MSVGRYTLKRRKRERGGEGGRQRSCSADAGLTGPAYELYERHVRRRIHVFCRVFPQMRVCTHTHTHTTHTHTHTYIGASGEAA